jgi:hypothetical protein
VKLLAVLLLALLFGLVNPDVREKLAPHAELALEPIYNWKTNSRLAEITRMLEAESAAGRRVPTTSEALTSILEANTAFGGGTEDAWGTPFQIVRSGFTVRVVSAGPDRVLGTRDDLRGPAIAANAR